MNNPKTTITPRWVARPRWIRPTEENTVRDGVEVPHPNDTFVFFVVSFPRAERVRLIGTFTGWENHPLVMDRAPNGTWFTTVPLSQGRYEYAYLVDDHWQLDPASPQASHRFGPRVNECVV
jgi:1,4-alpha-glucan branching enzyme